MSEDSVRDYLCEDKPTSRIYHDSDSSPRCSIDKAEQGADVRQYGGRHIWRVQKEPGERDLGALVRLLEQVVCTESQVYWASGPGPRMMRRKDIYILTPGPRGLRNSNAVYLVTQRV